MRAQIRTLQGSERKPLEGAKYVGQVDGKEAIKISIYLRDPAQDQMEEYLQHYRPGQPHMTREEYEANHSASHSDIKKVKQFAHEYNMTVAEIDPVSRKIVLAGSASMMSKAFGTQLSRYEYQGRTHRLRQGNLTIPAELEECVIGVLGLDNRPQVHAHVQHLSAFGSAQNEQNVSEAGEDAENKPEIRRQSSRRQSAENKSEMRGQRGPQRNVQGASYTPLEIAKLYSFPGNDGPNKLTGKNQCIGILEFGGGFTQTDLQTYFTELGISTPPQVTSISVDGGINSPGTDINDPQNADAEVYLDIEVVGAIAPDARIVVYFGGEDDGAQGDRSFADTLNAAIHDKVNNPSIISISWGGAEIVWTPQSWNLVHQALQAATALGITVCVAAGDHGVDDFLPDDPQKFDKLAHVDYPASDPFVLGCGGTSLQDVENDQIISEVAWNNHNGWATGGGISDLFDLPAWQQNAGIPASVNPDHKIGRGVPDVAANADGQTGYRIYGDGEAIVLGGTSAVAPLMAGLIARLNQANGGKSLGFINPTLYANAGTSQSAVSLRDITQGDNATEPRGKKYSAGPNWDACTGLGVPDFARVSAHRQGEENGQMRGNLPAVVANINRFDVASFLDSFGLEVRQSNNWNNVVDMLANRLKVRK